MSARRILLIVILVIILIGAAALVWAARHGEIDPIAPPDPTSFDPSLVDAGRQLAGMGNCGVCHTSEGGQAYAGGLALPTPFGVIYSTNITPDPQTGIGAWSEEAFRRAMHQGVDREGNYLYPAFPYDHFTRVTDEDISAIYAYFMSDVQPVEYTPPENELPFPFNIRLAMAGWNLLFLDEGRWEPDPSQDEEWNRGAYLVEGLGHCSSCHTARNFLGAELSGDDAWGGAFVEGWFAPGLDETSPMPIPWTQFALVNYLIDGWDGDHGIAAGPMTPVVNDLYEQSEDDVFAIAAYLMSLRDQPLSEEQHATLEEQARAFAEPREWDHPEAPEIPDDPQLQLGARVFEAQCTDCHRNGGQPVPLGLTSTVNHPDPTNLIRVTLYGIQPPRGVLNRSMPARDIQINDEEMVALAHFVRARFSQHEPWENVAERVQEIRHGEGH